MSHIYHNDNISLASHELLAAVSCENHNHMFIAIVTVTIDGMD